MRPSYVGEQVLVLLDPAQNNGEFEAVAWVSQVWGPPYGYGDRTVQTVNVRVLGDCSEVLWLTSVRLYEERPRPEELAEVHPNGYRMVAFRKHVEF